MNDYSDLFYTVFSIVIFSFLLLQANSLILRNELVTIDHEYEKTAIAVAQSIIEEARTKPFDANMNPDNFTEYGSFGQPETKSRDEFLTFDDYHNYTERVQIDLQGFYDVRVMVDYVTNDPPFDIVNGEQTMRKRMSVTVSDMDENDIVTLSYIKSFFEF